MVRRLFSAKPLHEPMLTYCQLEPEEQTSMKFELKYKLFIHENTFENAVCEFAAILSRGGGGGGGSTGTALRNCISDRTSFRSN